MPRKPISFELDFMIKDIFPRFTVKQFDDVSFNIKPLNQGLEYDTSNMIGKIYVGVNNDMFMQTTGITVSNDNINVLLDKNMLQKNGRAYAEIELTDEDGTITSSSFIFDIDPKIGEGGMIPGEYEGFVEKYERLISEFKAQINSNISNSNDLVDKAIKNCNTSVDNKLNTVDTRLNTKFSEVDNKLNTVDNRVNAKISEVDTKLSTVDSRLNSKVSEVDTKLDTVDRLIIAKVSDFEKRFNRLTASQQQDAEVIEAREEEVSLKARLDRDIENPKKLYTAIEGTEISTNSSEGYLKDVEILGNTVQDINNLADIRSVGDKLENQELYEIPVLCTNGLDSSDSNYKEHKLTILSPVQLEKVGDVADRIICKDGVWGVEKNINTVILDGTQTINDMSSNTIWSKENTYRFTYIDVFSNIKSGLTSSGLNCISSIATPVSYNTIINTDVEGVGVCYTTNTFMNLSILKSKVTTNINEYLSENNITVKYIQEPTFIPLPYDQQIKIRTFANKTNISFGCEIEPTLKASVPKSIGASVSSHSEQIDNLSKELEKINNLEETVTSEVVSESDFITVENTNSGYFSDIKLEGKTLILNADNEVVEAGTEGATLKSVGQDVDDITIATTKAPMFFGKGGKK